MNAYRRMYHCSFALLKQTSPRFGSSFATASTTTPILPRQQRQRRFQSSHEDGSGKHQSQIENEKAIRAIQYFVKNGNIQSYCQPGFNHALKLSFHTMDWEKMRWCPQTNTLSYRYTLEPKVVSRPTVGLFTALMDELSTDACFARGQPSAPGWSLHIQTKLFEAGHGFIRDFNSNNDIGDRKSTSSLVDIDIDIRNTVTRLGRFISFTRTEFVLPSTNDVLALSTQVKYMPTGDRWMDLVYNKPWVFQFFKWYHQLETVIPDTYPQKSLFEQVLKPHLRLGNFVSANSIESSDGTDAARRTYTAFFTITKEHTNMLGTLHGAGHAMVMELAAEPVAAFELDVDQGAAAGKIMLESNLQQDGTNNHDASKGGVINSNAPINKNIQDEKESGERSPLSAPPSISTQRNSTIAYLVSQQIDFMSAGILDQTVTVKMTVLDLDKDDSSISLRVQLFRPNGKTLMSDGTLQFRSS